MLMCSIRTAESVCAGHPDKLADQIADQILDDILYDDKAARVAVEVMAAGRRIIVTGEITTNHRPRIRESVRTALARAGYSPLGILIYVWTRRQSSDINAGVTTSLEARGGDSSAFALQGAGDQARSTVTPPPRPLNASRSRSSWHIASASVSILPRSRGRSAGSSRTARPR
ncbi:S-adenosylmethionine synthetase [Cutibacterium acnes JCM 18918]|nr:S-adenosylmethionine synthetase [Cutibacterium acnes JCM 18918]